MYETLLDIMMVILNIPILAVLIKIYMQSRYNLILLLIGSIVTVVTANILHIASITGPLVTGVFFFPQSFAYVISAIIIAYYLIVDKMWTLLTILSLMSFTLAFIMLIHQVPGHGLFSIPFAAIVWAWYKESKRCFNPMKCPIMKLEGKYL